MYHITFTHDKDPEKNKEFDAESFAGVFFTEKDFAKAMVLTQIHGMTTPFECVAVRSAVGNLKQNITDHALSLYDNIPVIGELAKRIMLPAFEAMDDKERAQYDKDPMEDLLKEVFGGDNVKVMHMNADELPPEVKDFLLKKAQESDKTSNEKTN